MLSISLMKTPDYYLDSIGDYYLEGGEPPGEWFGRGAARLGLRGKVNPDDFRNLFKGFRPSPDGAAGAALVSNAGNENRQAGWDLTFSAPKDVSVIFSHADEEIGNVIEECLKEAVKETLQHMENTIAYSRTGHAGMGPREKVDLTVALFPHRTSRALDPQLHYHCCVINVGFDSHGKSRAIISKLFYRYKMLGGGYFRAALAHLLEQRLGTRAERAADAWSVQGVPRWMSLMYSKRRRQVLREQAKLEGTSAKTAAIAAKASAPKKEEIPPLKELHDKWQAEAREERRKDPSLEKLNLGKVLGHKQRGSAKFIDEAIEEALERLTKNRAHFAHEDLFREALYVAPQYGIGPEKMLRSTLRFVATDKRLVRLDSFVGERYTTSKNLAEEVELFGLATRLAQQSGALVSPSRLAKVQKKHTTPDKEGRRLNREQEQAFLHLTQSKSSIRFLHGLAGTGKTSFTLRACVDAWKQEGFTIVGAAPTARAAKVLESDTGIACQTIHRLMGDYEVGGVWDAAKHHGKQLLRAAAKEKTRKRHVPKPIKLNRKSIVVIDEASMVNLHQFRLLLNHVEQTGATIVFLGDPYQIPPVEGTAPFLSLSRSVGYAELTEIKRQKQQWSRDASAHFYLGEPGKALQLYADHDRLVLGEDQDQTMEKLVDHWSTHGLSFPEKTLVLCTTNRECDDINQLCHERRREAGRLGPNRTVISDERDEGVHESTVYDGDRVVFTRNWHPKGIANGMLGTVTYAGETEIRVRLETDELVTVNVNEFKHIRLGYAVTTEKSQGSTVDYTYTLANNQMVNLPRAYVLATRAREDNFIFATTEVAEEFMENVAESSLAESMGRRPDLSLAVDFLATKKLSTQDRAGLFADITAQYLAALGDSKENQCIVAPSPLHAEGFNFSCHMKLAEGQSNRAVTSNQLSVVPGDKVLINNQVYGYESAIQGKRATVESIDENSFVRLKLDEPTGLSRIDTVVAKANQLDLDYAHALTVAEASQVLTNNPQPFFVLDSAPAFCEFLDVSPLHAAELHMRQTWQQWFREVAAAFGDSIHSAIETYRLAEAEWQAEEIKREKRRLKRYHAMEAYWKEEWARRRELEEQLKEQVPQTIRHAWADSWMDELVDPPYQGISQQIFQPTEYGVYRTEQYSAPTNATSFDRTYEVIAGQADMQQQQQRKREAEQHRRLLEQQAQQTYVQSQTDIQQIL